MPSLTPIAKKPAAAEAATGSPLELLHARIVSCERCERLRSYCTEIGTRKRRAYQDESYWGKPVPSFGDPDARLLVLGLAPGAHGSNRTGRPFTGDGSGNFLYPVLHDAGFASQPEGRRRDDGLILTDAIITSVARCAPPANKPTPEELRNCAPFLDEEIALLPRLRVIVCLGSIAWTGFLQHLRRVGHSESLSQMRFGHGAEYTLPNGRRLLGSYHPSLQNTNTGRLTREMLLDVFLRARQILESDPKDAAEISSAHSPYAAGHSESISAQYKRHQC